MKNHIWEIIFVVIIFLSMATFGGLIVYTIYKVLWTIFTSQILHVL